MASKERSPNYPAIGLSEAVDRLKKFYQSEGKTSVDQETAVKALGYGSLSGASRTKLAALKKYGLLQGRGDTISISPLGLRIVHPDDDAEYDAALREAAGTPDIFVELSGSHSQASENAIVAFLVKSKRFTEDGARLLAKSFKDTLAFAKLDNPAYIPADVTKALRGDGAVQRESSDLRGQQVQQPPPPGAVQRVFTTGSPTMDAAITITSRTGEITAQDIEDVHDYLATLLTRWKRAGDGEEEA